MTARVVPGKCAAEETKKTLLICDLDGTLVDSYPGIAEALRHACRTVGVEPRIPLDQSIVGPPLDELLRLATAGDNSTKLSDIRNAFIDYYDESACRLAQPFDGIEEMLNSVISNGQILGLATNKRLRPTSLILSHLGWRGHFDFVETVDSRSNHQRTKAEMLVGIKTSIATGKAIYLGDTSDDYNAASRAGMAFISAAWADGPKCPANHQWIAYKPAAVVQFIQQNSEA